MNVEEQRLAAARAVVMKVLAEEVTAEVKQARDALEPTMLPGDHITARLPDGDEIGSVVKSKRSRSVAVTDQAALLAYVRRARPDEIVVTESIRPSFLAYLLAEAKRQLIDEVADGLVVDTAGEIIPGIELVPGTSSYRPDATAHGRQVIRVRLSSFIGGAVAGVLALPPADQ